MGDKEYSHTVVVVSRDLDIENLTAYYWHQSRHLVAETHAQGMCHSIFRTQGRRISVFERWTDLLSRQCRWQIGQWSSWLKR
jgi:hypothetical protein